MIIWRIISLICNIFPTTISSNELLPWTNDASFDNSNSGICLRVSFPEYVNFLSRFRREAEEKNTRSFVGPYRPFFYKDYPGHVTVDEYGDSNDSIGKAYNTTGTNRNVVTSVSGADVEKNQLEADLQRLLAQESQLPKHDSVEEGKQNATTDQQAQQEAEPPLPSFNEWTKQKLEEQQQTKQQQQLSENHQKNGAGNGGSAANPSTGGTGSVPGTMVPETPSNSLPSSDQQEHARNYASKECGAKVLLANPQAQHSSSVLNEKEPDEYMLNPCNAEQKFFILELCETIQISRIDLANFELFSSSPKDFRIFVSERYPSTEWTFLGAWTAEDQRKIQHFPVEQRLYAKYVKVELLSHYGSEHFCPLSLIRVLGVSVVEEYEAGAAQEHRQQQQYAQDNNGGTTQVDLGEKPEEQPSPFDSLEVTPSDDPILQVPSLDQQVAKNIRQELLTTAKDVVVNLAKGMIDKAQAVFVGSKVAENTTNSTSSGQPSHRLVLSDFIYIGEHWRRCLMCDVSTNGTRKLCGYVRAFMVKRRPRPVPVLDVTLDTTASATEPSVPLQEENLQVGESGKAKMDDGDIARKQNGDPNGANGSKVQIHPTPPPSSQPYSSIPQDPSSLPGVATTAKETVFARLNNRIRALEQNISLSGEYLGELSLRYRRQMDDVQKAVNRSSSVLADHKRATEETLAQYRLEIDLVKAELEKLKVGIDARIGSGERRIGNRSEEREPAERGDHIITFASSFSDVQSLTCLLLFVLQALTMVAVVVLYCRSQKCHIHEHTLDAAVERRVQEAILEWQQLKKNGITMNMMNTGNGHLLSGRAQSTLDSGTRSNHQSHLPVGASQSFGMETAPETKAKKRARKRHQLKHAGAIRKSSDQTATSPKWNNTDGPATTSGDSHGQHLNRSPAGILFSSSDPPTESWMRVPHKSRRNGGLPNEQHRKGGSYEVLNSSPFLHHGSIRSLYSQNAFTVLASSSSPSDSCGKSPEKRPRSGRGPS